MITETFKSEITKTKRTFAFWITLLGPAVAPFIYLLIYFFKWKAFIPEAGANIWNGFISNNMSLSSGLFMPMIVIMIVALDMNIEYKSDSFKKLFVLPVSKEELFLGKVMLLIYQILFSLVVLFILVLFFGLILGITRPELGFLTQSIDLFYFIQCLAKLMISLLAIVAIQLFLSIISNNIIVSIAFGVMCIFSTLVIVQGWSYAIYEPYSFSITLSFGDKKYLIPQLWGINVTFLLSLLYFLVFGLAGMYCFKYKKLNQK
jgi:bacitracin transport system permease protein